LGGWGGDFLELMHAEDSPGFLPVGTGFATETGTVPGIPFGEFFRGKPLVHMER
jgi:hypothetical protein